MHTLSLHDALPISSSTIKRIESFKIAARYCPLARYAAVVSDLRKSFIEKPLLNPIEHSSPHGFLGESLARAGLSPEVFIWCPSEEVPEPFQALLVHDGDMTSTLERFYEERMPLEVLAEENSDGCYYREVILKGKGTGRVAEFGVIEIELDNFPRALQ